MKPVIYVIFSTPHGSKNFSFVFLFTLMCFKFTLNERGTWVVRGLKDKSVWKFQIHLFLNFYLLLFFFLYCFLCLICFKIVLYGGFWQKIPSLVYDPQFKKGGQGCGPALKSAEEKFRNLGKGAIVLLVGGLY